MALAQDDGVEFRFEPGRGPLSIPVKVNGTGPYHFLLDTGVRGAISLRLADILNIPVVERSFPPGHPMGVVGLGGEGRNPAIRFAEVQRLEVGPYRFERPWNLALDLSNLPVHADGLLGYNVMKDLITVIDFRQRWVRFQKKAPRLPEAKIIPFRAAGFVLPGQYVRHLIFLNVRVNGREPLPFVLDTGTDRSVLSSKYLDRAGIRRRGPGNSVLRAYGLSGEIPDISTVLVDSLSFAGFSFRRREITSFDLSGILVGEGVEIAGLLGVDLLQNFVVWIDFSRHRVAFLPK